MRRKDWVTADRGIGIWWLADELRLGWQERPLGEFDKRCFVATPAEMAALATAFEGAAAAPDHASFALGDQAERELLLVRDPIYTDIRLNADGRWLYAMPHRTAIEMADTLRKWTTIARIEAMDLSRIADRGSLRTQMTRSR